MLYKCFIDGSIYDLDGVNRFKTFYDEKYDYLHIEFSDENAAEVFRSLNFQNYYDFGWCMSAFGKDGRIYELTPNGIMPSEKKIRHSYETEYKIYCNYKDRQRKNEAAIAKDLKEYNKSGIYKKGISLFGYKSFVYADVENNISVPFRLKGENSKEKKPLVVYFHWAPSLGSDNCKQMLDFLPIKSKLEQHNCFILLPQAPKYTNDFVSRQSENYYSAIRELIGELLKTQNIDNKRIYLIGTSFGGCCVWQLLWNNPGFFACGVPVMGQLHTIYINKANRDLSRISNIPIWIAHSANDSVVSIKTDDFSYAQLKKLNSPVKYTRMNKYGHAMYLKFYKWEKWCDWMFEQSL